MYNIASEHLVIVRTGGSVIDIDSYNCQEIGLAKALTKKGLKVSVVLAGKTSSNKVIHVNDREINIYFVKYCGINQALSWFFKLESLLHKLSPTCIQIHEFGMMMSFRVLKWAQRYHKRIYLIQGSYRTTQKPFFKQLELLFNKIFGRYILNNVNGIGYKSPMAARYLQNYTKRRLSPTYIGLDIDKFNDINAYDDKKAVGIDPDKKVIIYVGKLEKRRNPDVLLDIAKLLPKDYIMVMVGTGPMYDDIKRVIDKNSLQSKCLMLGNQKQETLPAIYKMADLFLLISDYEIYGMVILEAMYYGVPVISTNNAGAEVLINDGFDGVIINNKDSVKWKDTILQLMSDNAKLQSMSISASSKIKNFFLWSETSNQFLQLYQIQK